MEISRQIKLNEMDLVYWPLRPKIRNLTYCIDSRLSVVIPNQFLFIGFSCYELNILLFYRKLFEMKLYLLCSKLSQILRLRLPIQGSRLAIIVLQPLVILPPNWLVALIAPYLNFAQFLRCFVVAGMMRPDRLWPGLQICKLQHSIMPYSRAIGVKIFWVPIGCCEKS